MDQDLKKLKKLASLMKKEGILSYKTPEIELQIAPAALTLGESTREDFGPDKSIQNPDSFTPEQILLWSAPGMDDSDDEKTVQ